MFADIRYVLEELEAAIDFRSACQRCAPHGAEAQLNSSQLLSQLPASEMNWMMPISPPCPSSVHKYASRRTEGVMNFCWPDRGWNDNGPYVGTLTLSPNSPDPFSPPILLPSFQRMCPT